MGQYTIKDVQNRAELLKDDIDNIYRALNDKLGSSPENLEQVPEYILSIPDPPTEEPLTITPTIDGQEISALDDLKYNPITVEPVTSAIDSNIQPENIKEGVVILGVTGTLSGGSGVFMVPPELRFGYSKFTEFPSNWDFSEFNNVTDMSNMFYNCLNLTAIPQLDTHNVTKMDSMFLSCEKLTSIPQLDTHNVTSMNNMFGYCSSLTTIPQLDTSKVTDMYAMFNSCSNLTVVEGIDFSGLTSNLTRLFGSNTSASNITRFIVNGKINVSTGNNSIKSLTAIDYDSVKSILAAADRTDNTNAKELAFNRTIADQNGELAALVASCSTKGWTISGLTLQ